MLADEPNTYGRGPATFKLTDCNGLQTGWA